MTPAGPELRRTLGLDRGEPRGLRKSAWLTRVIVAVVLAVLASVVAVCPVPQRSGTEQLGVSRTTPAMGAGVPAAGVAAYGVRGRQGAR